LRFLEHIPAAGQVLIPVLMMIGWFEIDTVPVIIPDQSRCFWFEDIKGG